MFIDLRVYNGLEDCRGLLDSFKTADLIAWMDRNHSIAPDWFADYVYLRDLEDRINYAKSVKSADCI